jgi:hypothetical protein
MAVDTRPCVTISDPTLWQRVFRIRPTRKDSISKAFRRSVSRLASIWSHRNRLLLARHRNDQGPNARPKIKASGTHWSFRHCDCAIGHTSPLPFLEFMARWKLE